MATHDVLNQPPPLEGYDVYGADLALADAVARHGAPWAVDRLHALGEQAGAAETIALGTAANEHPPQLHTHDRYGNRIDTVDYHPAYHELMRIAVERGRGVKPDLKLGICGEHGGEPKSVAFCHRLGLDYVSCSPYRVPLARLSAAQAALAERGVVALAIGG